ncbi:MAG: UbiA family prenyltransferase [Planctomycetota bacterium]
MKHLGRLVRLSLFPSAVADAACGVVLGAALWPAGPAPWLMIASSLGVYHGGMALNDWADRELDARERPDRPIPSGAIRPGAALALALFLLVGGVACALAADPVVGLVMTGVAAAAVVYDLAGRGAWRGPLLLGLCRAGNLGAAALLGARAVGVEPDHLVAPALLYGAYVFVVSRLGRMEDAEDDAALGQRPTALLLVAAAFLCLAAFVPFHDTWPNFAVRVALGVGAAISLYRGAEPRLPWTRPRVMRSMGLALRRLLVFPVLFALSAPGVVGFVVGGLTLLGWPISARLRKVFPPS